MRVAIGQLVHETNTFSTIKTTIELFKLWEWDIGADLIKKHKGVNDFLGGMIDKGEELKVELIPTFSAFTVPSGIITKETYLAAKDNLLKSLEKAGPIDAVCFYLHGAGVAEETEDIEGDLVAAIRELVGEKTPIVVNLDLHANVTDKMIKAANLYIGNNLYPHTDSYERGMEAMDLAFQLVQGTVKVSAAYKKLPLMIPTSTTYLSPVKELNDLCRTFEDLPDVIDCTFYHGFPYSDFAENGASVIVTTNNNVELARKLCEEIVKNIWEARERFFKTYYSPKEAIQYAMSRNDFPIVINEASDNPGAGTSGDGTCLLKAMLEANVPGTCFGFIYDPEAAFAAHKAGAGSTISIKLGGKTDSFHGSPLSVTAYVKCLTDGSFHQTSPMWKGSKVNLGKSARLQIGNVDVIVTSIRSQTFDDQVFLLHGIDVTTYKAVALKSSHHFRAAFQTIAKEIITVDSPGLSTSDLSTFQFKNIKESIYPLHLA
ncbi:MULTISPECIES: M81 family metallopeptidase [Bacillus]|uniref:MlrC domain protein n=2 Tax=Bacillus TaxID=1386 RepID=A0A0M4FSP7_9BACI|nr:MULTISPECIES: M81 family metallopeptidase [Bacillus]ALC82860.1 MlrC domain protein [Bacillus gobiensis]MBP1081826.1 microcystin degradation protein MlrC [Bacillus capparidis]MED1096475.1 M81 family metallopeptidase [Bacillus capparidis]